MVEFKVIQPKLGQKRTYRRRRWVSRSLGTAAFKLMMRRVPGIVSLNELGKLPPVPWWMRVLYRIEEDL